MKRSRYIKFWERKLLRSAFSMAALICIFSYFPFATPNIFVAEAGLFNKSSVRIVEHKAITHHPEKDYIPSWSPDGQKIAFTSYRSDTEEIWVMDKDGGNFIQLTHNAFGDWSPAWSPDGKTIALTSDRTGLNQIWLMDSNGLNQRPLTSSPSGSSIWNRDPSWSPDGSKLIFTSNRSGKDENWIMDLQSEKVWRHSNGMAEHWHPSFSPDGKQVLFSSNMTGDWGLWLSDLEGNQLVRMVKDMQFDNNPAASWSPDGSKIVFRNALADLWLMNSDGSQLMPLTKDGKADGWRSSWSPDGKKIAYTAVRSEGGSSDIWIITLE